MVASMDEMRAALSDLRTEISMAARMADLTAEKTVETTVALRVAL